MNQPVIMEMLREYACTSEQQAVNALREIMQNVALFALSRQDFFSRAAFYGGTALRILYGLNRGSEDMDFSLLKPDREFELGAYANGLETVFASFGMNVTFSQKLKVARTDIQSGFLKGNTQAQLLSIGLDGALVRRIHSRREMKIKIEVDVQPPPGFKTEIKYLYRPQPFAVRACTLPDLLAGKLHAVLFRSWGSRVKGRDWYDLAWYAGAHPAYNLQHLESRARQSGDYSDAEPLTDEAVHTMLEERLNQMDMNAAAEDVRPFLRAQNDLTCWSREFFLDAFRRLYAEELGSTPPSSTA